MRAHYNANQVYGINMDKLLKSLKYHRITRDSPAQSAPHLRASRKPQVAAAVALYQLMDVAGDQNPASQVNVHRISQDSPAIVKRLGYSPYPIPR